MMNKVLLTTVLSSGILAASDEAEKPAKDMKSEGYVKIFNGKDLEGWYPRIKSKDEDLAKKVFAVKDEMIRIINDQIFPTGIECQIHYNRIENENHTGDFIEPKGVTYDWYYSEETEAFIHPDAGDKLYNKKVVFAKNKKKWLNQASSIENYHGLNDKWNRCETIVMGEEYTIHKLNGEIVNMYFNMTPEIGLISFQSETAEIFYRDIKIKEYQESVPVKEFLTNEV